MSSSLDKLKALTSKLEEKLEQKKNRSLQTLATETQKPESTVLSDRSEATPIRREATVSASVSEDVRQANIDRVRALYEKLKIIEKSPDFEKLFLYKAMNLSGIGLKEEDFGQIREGKYIQVIAITYEPDKNGKKKAKNISLGYFGKAESLEPKLKNEIIEFVLRWRYEKAFQNVEHYKELIEKIDMPPADSLF